MPAEYSSQYTCELVRVDLTIVNSVQVLLRRQRGHWCRVARELQARFVAQRARAGRVEQLPRSEASASTVDVAVRNMSASPARTDATGVQLCAAAESSRAVFDADCCVVALAVGAEALKRLQRAELRHARIRSVQILGVVQEAVEQSALEGNL